jgi:lipoate-protein ligase A
LLHVTKRPTLRFYRWGSPAVSFGYFSRFEDVRAFSNDRELVRRWTGGGIVMHGHDLTYSFVIPPSDSLFGKPAREIYSLVHRAITTALARGGIDATLASSSAPRMSDACFANPVNADVLIDGRKVAGAAQRRSRAGLLQQGSIQIDSLPQEFSRELSVALCVAPRAVELSSQCLDAARELAEQKYGTAAWLTRR